MVINYLQLSDTKTRDHCDDKTMTFLSLSLSFGVAHAPFAIQR